MEKEEGAIKEIKIEKMINEKIEEIEKIEKIEEIEGIEINEEIEGNRNPVN